MYGLIELVSLLKTISSCTLPSIYEPLLPCAPIDAFVPVVILWLPDALVGVVIDAYWLPFILNVVLVVPPIKDIIAALLSTLANSPSLSFDIRVVAAVSGLILVEKRPIPIVSDMLLLAPVAPLVYQ